MGLPPSLVHAAHFTDMEVEDAASTAKMVGAEGTNVCVMASKSSVQSWLPNPYLLQENDTLKNFLSLSEENGTWQCLIQLCNTQTQNTSQDLKRDTKLYICKEMTLQCCLSLQQKS